MNIENFQQEQKSRLAAAVVRWILVYSSISASGAVMTPANWRIKAHPAAVPQCNVSAKCTAAEPT
jgi:hypothetical protein